MRLAQVLPQLDEEFAGKRTPDEIRVCADAILAGFADARVKSYSTLIAHRQTRECLRRETCDALAVA